MRGVNASRARYRGIAGWLAAFLSCALAAFYLWWGIVQNFHMGWYLPTLVGNLTLAAEYLAPGLVILLLALAALRWSAAGAALHCLAAVAVAGSLLRRFGAQRALDVGPLAATAALLTIVGLLYWIGRPRPLAWVRILVAGVPLVVLVASGAKPAYRAFHRLDDSVRTARAVAGNGVSLTWAPAGPGWLRAPRNWEEARWICSRLRPDGLTIASEEQNYWRLPSADELIRSLTYQGRNVGGAWRQDLLLATFAQTPEKEAPLWDTRSPIIYWWTSSETDRFHALAVCFNGRVIVARKSALFRGRGFRAVRNEARPSTSAAAEDGLRGAASPLQTSTQRRTYVSGNHQ